MKQTQRRQMKKRRETSKGRLILLIMLIITAVVYAATGREIFDKKESTVETDTTEMATSETNMAETAKNQEEENRNMGELKAQIQKIKEMELGKYTDETVQRLIETITAAQILIEENADQEKLDEMGQRLEQAVEALVISQ